MRIEDREEFVDQVVIDRIEERDRIGGLVNLVVTRVLELQREQALAQTAKTQPTLDAAPPEAATS